MKPLNIIPKSSYLILHEKHFMKSMQSFYVTARELKHTFFRSRKNILKEHQHFQFVTSEYMLHLK